MAAFINHINPRRRIWTTPSSNLEETRVNFRRMDDTWNNGVEMTRFLIPELLNKILKFPAVRKLFPPAKLMEHGNIDIQDHL